jgi:hypothetical protein
MQLDLLDHGAERAAPPVKLSRQEGALLRFLEQWQIAIATPQLQRELQVTNVSSTATGLNRKLAAAEDRRRVACGTWFLPDGAAVRGWRLVEMPTA